jgi:hypothetical protein
MDYSKVLVPAGMQASAATSTKKPEALGLDFLSTLKVAERVNVEIPFPVILTWDNVVKDGKIAGVKNIRFFTSELENASFEVSPVFEPGFVVDARRGDSGTLVVSCAKQHSMYDAEKNEEGFTRISFKARPKFVSFNGREAVKFADAKSVGLNLHELMVALNPQSPAEGKED